jgi:CDGSH-type Zn-finger protein
MPSSKVTIKDSGPLLIEGDFEVCDAQGKSYGLGGRRTIGLCRCGHSANKPFCDGAHKRNAFEDKQEARDLPPPPQV